MLFPAKDCALLIIDVQQTFLDKLPASSATSLLAGTVWLTGVAEWLHIPVFATVEEGRYPLLARPLAERIGQVFMKNHYNAGADHAVAQALREAARPAVVVTGLETDVCVAQTVLGLLGQGYRVAYLEDLTAALGQAHDEGCERMRRAGAVPLSLRAIFYDWMGNAQTERAFRKAQTQQQAPYPIVL